MMADSSDDEGPPLNIRNDTNVAADRKIGGMDITKTIDDAEYMTERVRRERAFQWHSRWALPTYKQMKANVRKSPDVDITLEDVDLLPWGPGGMMNRREYERLQKGEATLTPKPRKAPKPKPPQKVPIAVKHAGTGREYELMVDVTSNTIEDVKAVLEGTIGMPASEQCLYKGATLLRDKDKILQDYGIQKGAVLDLIPATMRLHVEMPDGSKVPIDISPKQDTDQDIKKKIEQQTGMPVSHQILKQNGSELPRGRPAIDIGLKEGDVLQVEPKSLQITAQMPDGSKVPIGISPKDTAADIKQKIQQKTGMPSDQQILKQHGKELPDGRPAIDIGIKDGDLLNVEPKSMTVHCNMPDGTKVSIDISPKDTANDIKKKIEQKTGMPQSNQIVKKDGKELPNGRPAIDIGLKDGDSLDVEPKSITVNANMPDGSKVPIDISPKDTANDIKKKIEQKTGMPSAKQIVKKDGRELPNGRPAIDIGLKDGDSLDVEPKSMTVNVDMPDGSKVPIDISPKDTAEDIKQKIERKTGMPSPKQILKKGGRELPNGRPAIDIGIKDGDNLQVEPKSMTVNVAMPDGSKVPIDISPKDTAREIKDKIHAKTGMEPSQQILKKDGTELPTGQTATTMGLKDGDDLEVEAKANVTMPNGTRVPIEVSPKDTAQDMKEKIKKKTGMQPSQQLLKKNGKELPEGKSAQSMGIQNGDNLQVDAKPISVKVTTPDGKKIAILVKPSETPADIKQKIEQRTGLEVPRQILKRNGKELPDKRTVEDLEIQNGDDNLHVDLAKVTVKVNLPNGDQVEIQVDPYEPVQRLKKDLEPSSGIPADNQDLFKDGTPLDNDKKPAREYGIRQGTVLDLHDKHAEQRRQAKEAERQAKAAEGEKKARDKHDARMARLRRRQWSDYNVEEANRQRERAYHWYSRLGQPDKKKMQRLVANLPPSCDITVQEIDLLPWVTGNYICDVNKMTAMITNDGLTKFVEKMEEEEKRKARLAADSSDSDSD